MFKIFTATILSLLLSCSQVYAADESKIDFQLLSVKDWEPDAGEIQKVNVSEVKKGIFITAIGGWSGVYPKAAQMVKDRLISRGVKVVEKPEDADFGIEFLGNPFDIEEVEKQVTAGIDKVNLSVNAYNALVNPLTFTASLIPSLFNDNSKTMIIAIGFNSPVMGSRGKLKNEGKKFVVRSDITYKSNQKNATVSTLVYSAYIEDFINKHFVFDANSAVPTPPADSASAVPPVATNEAVPVAH